MPRPRRTLQPATPVRRSPWPARIVALVAMWAASMIGTLAVAGRSVERQLAIPALSVPDYHGPGCAYWHGVERGAMWVWESVEAWGRRRGL